MKIFKVYYENGDNVTVENVVANSRRSLKLPCDRNNVVKVVDITESFINQLKFDLYDIRIKIGENSILLDNIELVLKAVELY